MSRSDADAFKKEVSAASDAVLVLAWEMRKSTLETMAIDVRNIIPEVQSTGTVDLEALAQRGKDLKELSEKVDAALQSVRGLYRAAEKRFGGGV